MKYKLFLLSLFFSGYLFASNNCSSNEVYFKALYLQPNSSNLYYGAEALPFPSPSPNWKSLEIRPDFHFGFDLGARVHFNRTCTILGLNWEHLHSNDSESHHASIENMVGPYFNIGPDAFEYKKAYGKVKHEFDAVSFNFGKEFNCFGCLSGSLFAGINFVRIEQKITSKFSNNDETVSRKIESPSTFCGAGPGFGIDFLYHLCSNLSLSGKTSVGFNYGSLKNQTTFTSNFPEPIAGVTAPNIQKTTVPDRLQLVPNFNGKLGFTYQICFGNCSASIDFGYQAQHYCNAIQSVDMSSEVATPPESIEAIEVGVFALSFTRTLSDFFVTGPYFSVSVGF